MTTSAFASGGKWLARATSLLLVFHVLCLITTGNGSVQALLAQTAEKPDIEQVISRFTQAELELRTALEHYAFKWDLLVQTVDHGNVTGEFHRVSQISLGANGKRTERVLSFPPTSLRDMVVTPDDLKDSSAPRQFILEPANLNKYKLTYLGKEQVSDSDTYVFGVKPKAKEDLFEGKVWVSVQNLKIVKMHGKWTQRGGQKSPIMDFSRTLVDGYLFPSSISADDTLSFPRGSIHVRIEVRFSDYTKFQ